MNSNIGLYGKLPAHGDFLSRGLTAEFVEGWDDWLQRSLTSSQELLGENWLQIYLTSPIWRFVLSAGVVDAKPWAGVMMPSVDKVGRYFPLTLACPLPKQCCISELMVAGGDWFEHLETIALEGLQDDVDVGHLDEALKNLDTPPLSDVYPIGHQLDFARPVALNMGESHQNPLNSFSFLLDSFLQQRLPSYSLWWASGSQYVYPSFLVSGYLPSPQYFAAMLDGQWQQWNWHVPVGLMPDLLGWLANPQPAASGDGEHKESDKSGED